MGQSMFATCHVFQLAPTDPLPPGTELGNPQGFLMGHNHPRDLHSSMALP